MSVLNTYVIEGQTSASVPINSVTIEHWNNGTVRLIQEGKQPVVISEPNALHLIGYLIGKKFVGYPT